MKTTFILIAFLFILSPFAFAVDPIYNSSFSSFAGGWNYFYAGDGTSGIDYDYFTGDDAGHAYSGAISGKGAIMQELTGLSVGEELTFSGQGARWSGVPTVGIYRINFGFIITITPKSTRTCPGSTGSYSGFSVNYTVTADDLADPDDTLWVGLYCGDTGGIEGWIDNVNITGGPAATPTPTLTPTQTPTPTQSPTPYPTPSAVNNWASYR